QARCRRLPKGMKNWQAYIDLSSKIDAFTDMIPLIELMLSKSMKDRHWKRISDKLGVELDVLSKGFTLGKVLQPTLLEQKDEIEDICISATKEKDIDNKLKQLVVEWTTRILTFTSFKGRGELLLKGSDVSEMITVLEDSLMLLSSL